MLFTWMLLKGTSFCRTGHILCYYITISDKNRSSDQVLTYYQWSSTIKLIEIQDVLSYSKILDQDCQHFPSLQLRGSCHYHSLSGSATLLHSTLQNVCPTALLDSYTFVFSQVYIFYANLKCLSSNMVLNSNQISVPGHLQKLCYAPGHLQKLLRLIVSY